MMLGSTIRLTCTSCCLPRFFKKVSFRLDHLWVIPSSLKLLEDTSVIFAGTAALTNDEEVEKDENCKDAYSLKEDICGWFVGS